MLSGTIIMLTFIVVVIYGGTGWLLRMNLQNEKRRNRPEEIASNAEIDK